MKRGAAPPPLYDTPTSMRKYVNATFFENIDRGMTGFQRLVRGHTSEYVASGGDPKTWKEARSRVNDPWCKAVIDKYSLEKMLSKITQNPPPNDIDGPEGNKLSGADLVLTWNAKCAATRLLTVQQCAAECVRTTRWFTRGTASRPCIGGANTTCTCTCVGEGAPVCKQQQSHAAATLHGIAFTEQYSEDRHDYTCVGPAPIDKGYHRSAGTCAATCKASSLMWFSFPNEKGATAQACTFQGCKCTCFDSSRACTRAYTPGIDLFRVVISELRNAITKNFLTCLLLVVV